MTASRPDSFGDLLRRYRQQAALTQEELAERADLSARAISELERGARQHPYRATIQLLAQALALTDEQLTEFAQAGRRPTTTSVPAAIAAASTDSAAPYALPHKHNLPPQLTSFIGRAVELARIRDLLRTPEVRLLTLTGPPGTGKTRLSIEVAAKLLAEFADGVYFVELATVSEAARVAATIAGTLGVKESAASSFDEGLQLVLKDRRLLLVLDNFEQIIDAAPLVVALLHACPRLKVLVTSREALHVRGEKEYPLPPLALPGGQGTPAIQSLGQYEAVRLFVERARDTKPDFDLTEENATAVVEICRRLDGLPLALEIAAARVKIFPPQALLRRLQHSLELLTGGDQRVPARQRTLQAAIAWSHDLLSQPEKELFKGLAIFAGGCTLEAIAAVCYAGAEPQLGVFAAVEALVSKSLLQQGEGYGQEPRFWMLETIREYAREQLAASGKFEELSKRHTLYFMNLAERIEPSSWSAATIAGFGEFEYEQENLRVALTWALGTSGDAPRARAEQALRICVASLLFWDVKGNYSEARRWLGAVLRQDLSADAGECSADEQAVVDHKRVLALIYAARMAMEQSELAEASALIEDALAGSRSAGDKPGTLNGLFTAGEIAARRGDYLAARTNYEQALLISRELADQDWLAMLLINLGAVVLVLGDRALARALTEESIPISKALGRKLAIALSLLYLGELDYEEYKLAEARAHFEESVRLNREQDSKHALIVALWDLASVLLEQGDLILARTRCAEGLAIARGVAEQRGIAHYLVIMAGIATRSGRNASRAATLIGAAEALLAATATTLWILQHKIYEQASSAAREQLGTAQFEAARRQGRTMPAEQVVDYALAEGEV